MAQSFIDRYYSLVDDYVSDPLKSKRITKEKKLRDFAPVEQQIWERLVGSTGQESTIGRAESTIVFQDGVSFYQLPGNFRTFIQLEHREGGDRNRVSSILRSIPMYDTGVGIEIIDSNRGFIVRPEPNLDSEQNWTLIYQKGPVIIHQGSVRDEDVTGKSIVMTAPSNPDNGELIAIDGYYNGSMVRVYSAVTGANQSREIVASSRVSDTKVGISLRHAFSPVPRGNVKYEITPVLPYPYDEVYAIAAAVRYATRRNQSRRRRQLISEWKESFSACKRFLSSNVADRGPSRILPVDFSEPDPYSDT